MLPYLLAVFRTLPSIFLTLWKDYVVWIAVLPTVVNSVKAFAPGSIFGKLTQPTWVAVTGLMVVVLWSFLRAFQRHHDDTAKAFAEERAKLQQEIDRQRTGLELVSRQLEDARRKPSLRSVSGEKRVAAHATAFALLRDFTEAGFKENELKHYKKVLTDVDTFIRDNLLFLDEEAGPAFAAAVWEVKNWYKVQAMGNRPTPMQTTSAHEKVVAAIASMRKALA